MEINYLLLFTQKFENLKPRLGNENFLAALRKENVEKNRSLNILAGRRCADCIFKIIRNAQYQRMIYCTDIIYPRKTLIK